MSVYRGEPPAGPPGGPPCGGNNCQEAAHHVAKAPGTPYVSLYTQSISNVGLTVPQPPSCSQRPAKGWHTPVWSLQDEDQEGKEEVEAKYHLCG